MAPVIHVLPIDLARGAQRFARALRDALDGRTRPHRTLVLFESTPVALHADLSLDIRPGALRRAGYDPRVTLRLRRTLAQVAPAVVVAHGGESLKYAALAGPRDARLVYYRIGSASGTHGLVSRAVYRALLRPVDLVATVSQDIADEVSRKLGLPADRVVVVPNGRDPAAYTPVAPRPPRRPRLVFVGHLTATKRPELFLDLVVELRRRGVDVDATVVGDGPMLEHVHRLGRASRVEVLGRRDDVPGILARSDLLVFTSVSEGEGMPGVLIEAGMAGLPVVSTDVPGARAVVEHGLTGIVVPVDDRESLIGAVHGILTDAKLREEMGGAGRVRCLRDFSIDASATRWHELLEGLSQ